MSMHLSEVASRFDDAVETDRYADVDASANGLQVGPTHGEDPAVEHVAFAVDAAVATVGAAVEAGADLLVTHHGVVWGGLDRVTGQAYRRVAPLVEAGLPLYVSHLPLDGHPEYGNAAGLADLLSLSDREPFASVGGEPVGLRGRARDPFDSAGLATLLDRELEGAGGVQVLEFGPEEIREVAVVTGSGADFVEDAADAGADALVTGEGKQHAYHEARERGLHVFLAGHYATETFGVRALASLAGEWGLETTYIEHPTGL
jgi:dinuclear metal center YbgI/SA1388 family protein